MNPITIARDQAIYREFLHLNTNTAQIDIADTCRIIALSPAPRFYVSEDRAVDVCLLLQAGKPITGMRPTKQRMFREIHRRVLNLRQRQPNLTLPDAVYQVITSPAPSYYLTPGTIRSYFFRHLRRLRRRV